MRFTSLVLWLLASILVAQPALAFFHNKELQEQLEHEKSQSEAAEVRAFQAEQRAQDAAAELAAMRHASTTDRAADAMLAAEADVNLLRAQTAESRLLAEYAQRAITAGDALKGINLALLGLPNTFVDNPRPRIHETFIALNDTLKANRLAAVLAGHTECLNTAKFNPASTVIVTASNDASARLWDAQSGEQIRALTGHFDDVVHAEFSPDGAILATVSTDDFVRLWDGQGTLLHELQLDSRIKSIEFSADSAQLLTASSLDVALWSVASGERIKTFRDNAVRPDFAAFMPDPSSILILESYGGQIWNAASEQTTQWIDRPHWLEKHGQNVHLISQAKVSPDGSSFVTLSVEKIRECGWMSSVSADPTARIWDASTGKEMVALQGHDRLVVDAAFHPGGQVIATASIDGTARLWNVATGAPLRVIDGHGGQVLSVAFSADGTMLLTGSTDGTAKLWNSDDGSLVATIREPSGHLSGAYFDSRADSIVTLGGDNNARVWRVAEQSYATVFTGHEGHIWAADFSPDESLILSQSSPYFSRGDGTARLWSTDTGDVQHVFQFPKYGARSAVFSPDGTTVLYRTYPPALNHPEETEDIAKAWHIETGNVTADYGGHKRGVFTARYSPDGKRVLTRSNDSTAKVFDAQTGKLLFELEHPDTTTYDAIYSPDGRFILTVAADRYARLWDPEVDGDPLYTFRVGEATFGNTIFSPDGKYLAVTDDFGRASLHRVATDEPPLSLPGLPGTIWNALFHPNGREVLTLSNGALLIDIATGQALRRFDSFKKNKWFNGAFSPDGKIVAFVTENDPDVWLWETETGEPWAILTGHTDLVTSVKFSRDGSQILTASKDGTVRLWQTPDKLVDQAIAEMKRLQPLTEKLCQDAHQTYHPACRALSK